MRWMPKQADIGQLRTRTEFAWLPVRTNNGEMVWLGRVVIVERRVYTSFDGSFWDLESVTAKDPA